MSLSWRDALMRLHVGGWDADDIDEACEAIYEACTEGTHEGVAVEALTPLEVCGVLNVELDEALLSALQAIAALRGRQDREADDLRQALYDLDAFAYDYAGDD